MAKVKKQPADKKPRRISHSGARVIVITVVCVLLLALLGMVGASIVTDISALGVPGKLISQILTPVQTVFQGATDSVVSYLRTLKTRGAIEKNYNELLAKVDELTTTAMMANEYAAQLAAYQDLNAEMTIQQALNPLRATVINRDTGAYSATYTINVGTRDGVDDYMAVIVPGALVGYTYSVTETRAMVRTIIDSEASTPAMIESTRDQGTLRGTLGIDGTPMCRMYYLPEDNQPRPGDSVVTSGVGMEIPKGIPVGTVRESTRSLDANKQYIVVEPLADFQHIEYVLVLRYQPESEAAQERQTGSVIEFVPLATARPVPTLLIGESSAFSTETPAPGSTDAAPTASATPDDRPATPTPTANPDATPIPGGTDAPDADSTSFTYQRYTPTPSPSPSPIVTPSPTPSPTYSPQNLLIEEDP